MTIKFTFGCFLSVYMISADSMSHGLSALAELLGTMHFTTQFAFNDLLIPDLHWRWRGQVWYHEQISPLLLLGFT